jgi:hypothetical protein
MPLVLKNAKDTLTGVELNHGDTLRFRLRSGEVWTMELKSTAARIVSTNLKTPKTAHRGGRTVYTFTCDVVINGKPYTFEREVPTQKSFYEPWLIDGVWLWFDAVDGIFEFLNENHQDCAPNGNARFAIQDATLGICPEPLHPWCPLPPGGIKIEEAYEGNECWLGPYQGADAHGGMDINHPVGTPLWAPLDFDDQFYFNSVAMGHNNNRWRGLHRWPNGAEWILQAHHMTRLTVPEHTPLKKGQHFADGAGVNSGEFHHSHFMFKIHDEGDTVLLDPWILFWQMYRDQAEHPLDLPKHQPAARRK